jgi:hypothetical protein
MAREERKLRGVEKLSLYSGEAVSKKFTIYPATASSELACGVLGA